MLKIAIIDDEKNVRVVIKRLLSLIGIEHTIVGESSTVIEAIMMVNNVKPDVVLLDIQLEDGTGFDFLDQIENIDFKLVFITAYNEHAIKAFKFNALDYILKPIDPQELAQAISKAKNTLNSENTLKLLLKNKTENEISDIKKLVIKTSDQTHFIPINELYYLKSDGSYTKIFAKKITLLASRNLKHFQELLPDQQFIRTHQSYIVNKHYIKRLKDNFLTLNNDVQIPISARKKTKIKEILMK